MKRQESYRSWKRRLASAAFRDHTLTLWYCKALKTWSTAEETEDGFRARLSGLARKRNDLEIERLRSTYSRKRDVLRDRERRAERNLGEQESQLEEQRRNTWISWTVTLLAPLVGLLRRVGSLLNGGDKEFGSSADQRGIVPAWIRKALSIGTAGRLGTTLRRGNRVRREEADVERSQEELDAVRGKLDRLNEEEEAEIAPFVGSVDPASFELEPRLLRPRKGDLALEEITLIWTPWMRTADNRVDPLFRLE